MFGRRPGFSKGHSRRVSRRVKSATVGTHVSRPAQRPRHAAPAAMPDQLDFSSRKRTARARRGEINQVVPNTASRESRKAYAHRVGQLDLTAKATRSAKRKGIVVGVILLVLLAAIVGLVVTFTYINSVSSKMALDDDAARSALVAPAAGKPYYTLLAAPFAQAGSDDVQADMLMLARIDTAGKQVTLVSIPPNMETTLSDGEVRPIREAQGVGGDAEVIKTVASFAGVPISHYVKIDEAGLKSLVDALGGVSVAVPEEVDDPLAGSDYLAPGTQTLNGNQAFTFCRARNYLEGTQTREANQRLFMAALAEKLLAVNTTSLPAVVDTLSTCIKTDYSAADITGLIEGMRGLDAAAIYSAAVPGSSYIDVDKQRLFTTSATAWKTLMATVEAGGDPAQKQQVAPSTVDPKSFTITVRNGSDVTGLAAETAALLSGAGFQVSETGNAESPVYTETLVVYKDPAKADAANAVVAALGSGRATDLSTFYTFSTDVLVMIGKDYAPRK
ncbi:MAG: LCP family protein [Raoultibacter sp.]